VTAAHTIAASFAIDTYTITASAGANGSITPSGAVAVNCGDSQAFSIAANGCYHVADVLVDGVSVGAVTTYTFTNVTAAHTIAASFAIDTYTITASAGANGGITPSGAVVVNCGASQAFSIAASGCYHVADVLVDGVSVGAVTTYTFTNVTAAHTIAASFAIDTYTITASAGANGSITPSGAVSVNCGDARSFTIAANACYHIADVLVDGVSAGAVTTYTFSNVTANHTIAASFALNTYTITASAGANGSITPSGAVAVGCGASQAFTITPATGYHVADVLVDGASAGAVASYTFSNVTANHTIAASFAINQFTITVTPGANGSITPSGPVSVSYGGSATFTIAADGCYHIASVVVDGVPVGAVTTYTFSNVTANHTIAANFAVNTYTISASASANGSISPSGAVTVVCAASQSFTITPSSGYRIADVVVDGVSAGTVGSYTFTNVTANHTIAASFALNSFTINASAGAHGTVTPSGAVAVSYGASQSFAIAADACYHVADVLVDGVSVGAVTSYTFTNVQAGHTLAASFAADAWTVTATAGAGGTITPSGAVAVACGGSQAFTIAVDGCHTLANVVVDGVPVGAVTSYTFTNVTANHTITTTVVSKTYTITPSTATGGTIVVSGPVALPGLSEDFPGAALPAGWSQYPWQAGGAATVSGGALRVEGSRANPEPYAAGAGRSMEFVATFATTPYQAAGLGAGNQAPPNEVFGLQQYAVFSTGGTGQLITRVYESNAPTDYTIPGNWTGAAHRYRIDWNPGTVTFSIDGAAVHTEALNFNGTMRPAFSDYTIDGTPLVVDWVRVSPYTFDCGSSPVFNIVADTGYHVLDVRIDGVTQGAPTSYTFTNLKANHTITATFAANVLAVDPRETMTLSLAGMRPNPAIGSVHVAFALPTSAPATLELIDLSGRVVRSQDVGSLGAGTHVVTLANGRTVAAGVYWLRLTQGGRALTAKATIMN